MIQFIKDLLTHKEQKIEAEKTYNQFTADLKAAKEFF